VLAGVRGRFDVQGSLAQPNAYDSELRHGVDADLASSRSFAVGLELRPSEVWEFGLVYRHRAKVEQDIDGELAGTIGSVPAQYRVDTVVTPAAYPSLLVLAAGYELGALGLFAEVAWEDFSEWPEPDTASTNSLTLAGVPLDLTTGPPPGRAQASPHDRLVPRVGVEYALVDRAETSVWLRAGYVFERSPLPAQRTTRWLDADRHTVTLGAGIETELGEDTTLIADAFGLATLLPERNAVENPAESGGRASGTQFVSGASVGLGF
jgi:long-subunit fatty acid transport protein